MRTERADSMQKLRANGGISGHLFRGLEKERKMWTQPFNKPKNKKHLCALVDHMTGIRLQVFKTKRFPQDVPQLKINSNQSDFQGSSHKSCIIPELRVNEGNISIGHGTGLLILWSVSCYSIKRRYTLLCVVYQSIPSVKNELNATNMETILGGAD